MKSVFLTRLRAIAARIGCGCVLALIAALGSGCASVRDVNLTVTSEPPGGYIVLQIFVPQQGLSDWVYLGNTPLVTVHQVNIQQANAAKTVTLKVMKEGYFDQTKVWAGNRFLREFKKQGGVFWNPHLVPSAR